MVFIFFVVPFCFVLPEKVETQNEKEELVGVSSPFEAAPISSGLVQV